MNREPTANERRQMDRWNAMTETERAETMRRADTARPAVAIAWLEERERQRSQGRSR